MLLRWKKPNGTIRKKERSSLEVSPELSDNTWLKFALQEIAHNRKAKSIRDELEVDLKLSKGWLKKWLLKKNNLAIRRINTKYHKDPK